MKRQIAQHRAAHKHKEHASSIDSNRLREMALTSMVEARGRKAYAEEGALLSEAAARVAKSCSSTLMLQQFPILQRALADLSP